MTSDAESAAGAGGELGRFPAIPEEYIRGGNEWFSDSVRSLAEELHPFLKGLPRQTLAEFPDMEDESERNESPGVAEDDHAASESTTPPSDSGHEDFRQFRHRHQFTMSIDAILEFDIDAVLAHVYELAESLGKQQEQSLVRFMADSATASGNVVEVDNSNPLDSLIDGLEAVEVDFDDDGRHNLSIVVSEEFNKWINEHPPTAEQKKRIDDILEAKKEAQRAARSNRRLS